MFTLFFLHFSCNSHFHFLFTEFIYAKLFIYIIYLHIFIHILYFYLHDLIYIQLIFFTLHFMGFICADSCHCSDFLGSVNYTSLDYSCLTVFRFAVISSSLLWSHLVYYLSTFHSGNGRSGLYFFLFFAFFICFMCTFFIYTTLFHFFLFTLLLLHYICASLFHNKDPSELCLRCLHSATCIQNVQ